MIPFVAAGGLLIALGFLLAGYPIAQNDPDDRHAVGQALGAEQLDLRPADQHRRPHARRAGRLPRRHLLHHRGGRVRLPRPGAGRLHRLRDRRPPRPRPRLRRRRGLADRRRRLPRRPGRRHHRRLRGAVDQPLEAAGRRPRAAAGRDHPAARHADLQRPDGHRPGQAAGRGADRPRQLAERPDRHAGDPARHRARPDDVLRPGRPGEQGGLRLRHDRPHRRALRRRRPPAAGDHGDGHGRRHGAAAGDGAEHHRPAQAVHRRPSGTTARPPGCWAPRSSPRAPSRSRRPTRCGSSPR